MSNLKKFLNKISLITPNLIQIKLKKKSQRSKCINHKISLPQTIRKMILKTQKRITQESFIPLNHANKLPSKKYLNRLIFFEINLN